MKKSIPKALALIMAVLMTFGTVPIVGVGTVAFAAGELESISVLPGRLSMTQGQSYTFRAVGRDEDGQAIPLNDSDVLWAISDSDLAELGNKGLVTVKSTAEIGKTFNVTAIYNGKSASSTVTIIADSGTVASFGIIPEGSLRLHLGQEFQLSALGYTEINKGGSPIEIDLYKLSWSTRNDEYVSVSSKGVVKGVKATAVFCRDLGVGVAATYMYTDKSGKTVVLTDSITVYVESNSPLEHDFNYGEMTEPTCTEDGEITYTCSRCGYSYTETIPALGHDLTTVTVDAICTEAGAYITVCSRCDYYEVVEEIPALGHDLTTFIVDPTCTETGYTADICKFCGYESNRRDEVPALGHDLTTVTVDATCTEAGSSTTTCSRCDYEDVEVLPALGHRWNEGAVDKEPTCTETGVITYTCLNNVEHTYSEPIDPLGHDLTTVTVDATCTEDGSVTTTCSRCDYYEEVVAFPALGHQPLVNSRVIIEPNCTLGGMVYSYCAVCKTRIIEEKLDPLGHDYKYVTITPATCEEEGLAAYCCRRCKDTIMREPIPATGHIWDEGTETKPADCLNPGEKVYTCLNDPTHTLTETVVPALGHQYVETVVQPTCLTVGYTVYICERCGDEYGRTDEVPALGHRWNEGTVDKEPTCTEPGLITYTCFNDVTHTYSAPIDPLGHKQIRDTKKSYDADCFTDGLNVYKCERCDIELSREIVPALGHRWNEGTIYKEPTCTKPGVITYTCFNDVTHTYSARIDPLGHDFHNYDEGVVTEPTCTEYGYTTFSCSRCEFSFTANETPELGHDLTTVTVDATCTEAGSTTTTCSRCDYKDVEVIPALGHDFDEGVITEATCTEGGYTTFSCSRCDYSYTANETPELGHDLTTVTVYATCTEAGSETTTCSRCDYEEVVVFPAFGHDYILTVVPPTCTEGGYTAYICANCGHEYGRRDEAPALDHRYQKTVVPPTCLAGGCTLFRCERCGNEFRTNEKPATGHRWNDGAVTVPAECEKAGVMTFTCLNCGDKKTEAIPALGHDYSTETVEPTCTESGYTFHLCSRCGDSYYTAVEIPALGHEWGNWETLDDDTHTSRCVRCGERGPEQPHDFVLNENECVPATTTSEGLNVYYCSGCHAQRTEAVPKIDHEHVFSCVVTEPTCTEGGYTAYICAVCGSRYTADRTAPLGHEFGAWTVTTPATTQAAGAETRTCARCGAEETRSIPKLPGDDDPVFFLVGGTVHAGETVDVTVCVRNNPGIIGTRLDLRYDPQVLTLTAVRSGSVFGEDVFQPGGDLTAVPFSVTWLDALAENNTRNGTLVTFTFRAAADAPAGETPITITCDDASTFDRNLHPVAFAAESGTLDLIARQSGDVDVDGVVSLRDVVVLRRWFVGGWGIDIVEPNADVNGDGSANLLDVALITRWLAGGWDVELI